MTMKQIGSAITTSAKGHSSPISTPPTETGVVTQLSTEKKQRAVARLLQVGDPAQVDKNLASSLESMMESPLIDDTRTRYTSNGVDFDTVGYKLPRELSIEKIDQCIEAIQTSLAPLGKDEIKKHLTILSTLVVKPAGENADDMSIRIRSITEQLSEFPADIVVDAIKKVSQETTFWPAFAEFHKHIGWRNKRRQMLLRDFTKKKVDYIVTNQ